MRCHAHALWQPEAHLSGVNGTTRRGGATRGSGADEAVRPVSRVGGTDRCSGRKMAACNRDFHPVLQDNPAIESCLSSKSAFPRVSVEMLVPAGARAAHTTRAKGRQGIPVVLSLFLFLSVLQTLEVLPHLPASNLDQACCFRIRHRHPNPH